MSSPATPRRAWVRAPSDAYADCMRMEAAAPLDPAQARAQHQGYVSALRDAGIDVEIVPPSEGLPDACFVEDAAVILDAEVVVLTRPGAESRRAEVADLAAVLEGRMSTRRMTAPATLDGGDVMRLGSRFVVGRSSRTNDAGIDQLRAWAQERGLTVHAVDVAAGLHLKSACTALDADTVVVDPGALDPGVLTALGVEAHPVSEPAGANLLAMGDRVLVSAAAPQTARWLEGRGHRVVSIVLDELHRGDGALSCLSLRQPPRGGWSV